MNIQSIFSNQSIVKNDFNGNNISESALAQKRFANFLKDAIEKTNAHQITSDKLTERLVRGENVELHDVMIAAQKASISLNATLEVRNKIIEAYEEISRMQV